MPVRNLVAGLLLQFPATLQGVLPPLMSVAPVAWTTRGLRKKETSVRSKDIRQFVFHSCVDRFLGKCQCCVVYSPFSVVAWFCRPFLVVTIAFVVKFW